MTHPLKTLLAALAVIVFTNAPAFAQNQNSGQVIRDMVFSEVEKRIIREHYGVDATQQPTDTTPPEWAVMNGNGGDDEDEADDEDRAKADKGQKDKGKKEKGDKGDKGKDKAKGNGKDKQMPPGLAKRDELPPGLARQLKEKGRLPPGIAKRDLPADLASKLPARDDSQEVTVVDNDVVLVDKATGVILDVLKDVVTGGGQTTTNPDGTLAAPGPQSNDDGAEDTLLDTVLKSIFGGRSQ